MHKCIEREITDETRDVCVLEFVTIQDVKMDFLQSFKERNWHFYSEMLNLNRLSLTGDDLTYLNLYGVALQVCISQCKLVESELTFSQLYFKMRYAIDYHIDLKNLEFDDEWIATMVRLKRKRLIRKMVVYGAKLNFKPSDLAALLKVS